jgi:hypothetical protein
MSENWQGQRANRNTVLRRNAWHRLSGMPQLVHCGSTAFKLGEK